MKLTDKAAYLKGLAEGFDLSPSKPKNKLILEMINLITEMADKIEEIEDEICTQHDYIEELDHDLGALEEDFYEIDDECDCDDDDCCDCDDDEECDCCGDEDDDEEVFYEVTCPNCGEKVYFDETVDPSAITCPSCNEKFDCICDECDDCAAEDGCDCCDCEAEEEAEDEE
ncbi:MAG: hypothetical protein IJ493_01240 [Clostridia bacterium]|nr:hypothetical protein [Clostridia bacterium]